MQQHLPLFMPFLDSPILVASMFFVMSFDVVPDLKEHPIGPGDIIPSTRLFVLVMQQ